MPFTKDGLKPDIIINPHAIPSRMTIGQLVETIMTRLGLEMGSFMDSTAFNTSHRKIEVISELLSKNNFHSSGEEVLYNAMTGEQIESSIFMGPTYYMRLKHMVKDKINYRAQGPRTLLTRQTNHGRANDGGLRVGEMERDGIIAHGMSVFLKDSMMKRGDMYKMAICNHTGSLAIYDKVNDQLYSPILDGPIEFDIKNKFEVSTNKISKYGKDFSIVEVPFSFKLLMHELTSMNVHMRLITQSNINMKEELSSIKAKSFLKDSNVGKLNIMVQKGEVHKYLKDKFEDKLEVIDDPYNKPLEYYLEREEIRSGDINVWDKSELDDGKGFGYISTILNSEEIPTEILPSDHVYIQHLGDNVPNIYPLGWNSNLLDEMNIKHKYMADALKLNPVFDNWNRVIEKIKSTRSGTQSTYDIETIQLPPLERVINSEIQGNVQKLAIPQLNTSILNDGKPQMDVDMMQTLAGSKYQDRGYGMFGEMSGIVMHMKDSQKDYLLRLEPEQRTKILDNLKKELNAIPMVRHPKSDALVEDIVAKEIM